MVLNTRSQENKSQGKKVIAGRISSGRKKIIERNKEGWAKYPSFENCSEEKRLLVVFLLFSLLDINQLNVEYKN